MLNSKLPYYAAKFINFVTQTDAALVIIPHPRKTYPGVVLGIGDVDGVVLVTDFVSCVSEELLEESWATTRGGGVIVRGGSTTTGNVGLLSGRELERFRRGDFIIGTSGMKSSSDGGVRGPPAARNSFRNFDAKSSSSPTNRALTIKNSIFLPDVNSRSL